MLHEIRKTRQSGSKLMKRWFMDSDMDLFVWFIKQVPVRFQLSYNKKGKEHAIKWSEKNGFSHYSVDDGETTGNLAKMTPLLYLDGECESREIARQFLVASENMQASLADFIFAKLMECPDFNAVHSSQALFSTTL